MRKLAIATLLGLSIAAGQAIAADSDARVADRVGTPQKAATPSPAKLTVVRTLDAGKATGSIQLEAVGERCDPHLRCLPPRPPRSKKR